MSILVKHQVKTFGPKAIRGYGPGALIKAEVRFGDQCGNGHNTFSMTADIYVPGRRDIEAGGCLHDEIAKAFPELAPFVKWHLVSTDGPMHYIANTIYHADGHGPNKAWLKVVGTIGGVEGVPASGMVYGDLSKLKLLAEQNPNVCTLTVDDKTAKVANLGYARSSAVWPEATDEELTSPDLKAKLEARLPQLMADFQAAVESFGFTY